MTNKEVIQDTINVPDNVALSNIVKAYVPTTKHNKVKTYATNLKTSVTEVYRRIVMYMLNDSYFQLHSSPIEVSETGYNINDIQQAIEKFNIMMNNSVVIPEFTHPSFTVNDDDDEIIKTVAQEFDVTSSRLVTSILTVLDIPDESELNISPRYKTAYNVDVKLSARIMQVIEKHRKNRNVSFVTDVIDILTDRVPFSEYPARINQSLFSSRDKIGLKISLKKREYFENFRYDEEIKYKLAYFFTDKGFTIHQVKVTVPEDWASFIEENIVTFKDCMLKTIIGINKGINNCYSNYNVNMTDENDNKKDIIFNITIPDVEYTAIKKTFNLDDIANKIAFQFVLIDNIDRYNKHKVSRRK